MEIVPPDVPPFKLYVVCESAMLAKPPFFSLSSREERYTRMSDGRESKPHDGMVFACEVVVTVTPYVQISCTKEEAIGLLCDNVLNERCFTCNVNVVNMCLAHALRIRRHKR